MNVKKCTALTLLALAWQTLAWGQGGPPMLTDDPDTPGDGKWEINLAYVEVRVPGDRLRNVPRIDFNYGWGDRVQLKYETSWLFRTTDSTGTQSGIDNSLLGVKYRFLDEADSGANVSVYPQLELANTRSSVARGIASHSPNLFIPFEFSRAFGRLHVVLEVGYERRHSDPGEWKFGALGAIEISQTMEVMGELRRAQEKFLGGGETIMNVGVKARLSENAKLLAALGKGLGRGADSPSLLIFLGLQLVFGQEHR